MPSMPTDWKCLAASLAPDIPAQELDRVLKPLESLEQQFRPLVAGIPLETEPSYTLIINPEKPR
jgi:hypothetical protein